MKKNMGSTDRIIRVIAAIIFSLLYIAGIVSGTMGVILLIAGGIFLFTSFVSFCPLYLPFGINTCSNKNVK